MSYSSKLYFFSSDNKQAEAYNNPTPLATSEITHNYPSSSQTKIDPKPNHSHTLSLGVQKSEKLSYLFHMIYRQETPETFGQFRPLSSKQNLFENPNQSDNLLRESILNKNAEPSDNLIRTSNFKQSAIRPIKNTTNKILNNADPNDYEYEERITFLLREIESLKVYTGKLENENRKYSRAQEITAEYEERIRVMNDERDALESKYNKLEAFKSELEMRISSMETDHLTSNRFSKDLKKTLEMKIKENAELLEKLSFFEDFKRERDHYEQKLRDQQLKIDRMGQEIADMAAVSQKKTNDLENFRSKIMQLEDLNREVVRFKSEIKDWEIKGGFWRKEDDKKKAIIQDLQEKLRNLGKMPNYGAEVEERNRKILGLEEKLALLSTELSRLQEENKRLKEMMKSEREKLQEQMRRLLKEKDEEMQRLLGERDRKILEMSEALGDLQSNRERAKKGVYEQQAKDEKIQDLERKVALLSNQIKEYLESLRTKEVEIRDLMRRLQEKEVELKNMTYKNSGLEAEIARMSQILQEKEDEINELKAKLRESSRTSPFLESLQQEIRAQAQKNLDLLEEIERLKNLLNREKAIREDLEGKLAKYYELEALCEDLKRALGSNEDKGNEAARNFESAISKLRSLESSNEELRRELAKIIKERDHYLSENGLLVEKMQEMEAAIQNYERILAQTKETMSNMHERITQYESVILEIPAMEAEIEEKTQRLAALAAEIEELGRIRPYLAELEREISLLKEENQNYQYLLEKERQEYEKSMQETGEKLKRAENKMKELEERVAILKGENEKLKAQVNELLSLLRENEMDQGKEKDYVSRLEAQLAENDSLKRALDKKDEEIAELQASLEALAEENAGLRQEIEDLQRRLKELEEEIALYQSDIKKIRMEGSSSEVRLKDYETKLNSLLTEIQSLNGLVLKRNEEIDTWRTKYAQLELSLNEIRLKDTYLLDLEKRLRDLDFDNENLRKKMKEGSQNIFRFDESPFRNKIDELTDKIAGLNKEVHLLTIELEKKDREIGLKNTEIMHYKSETSRSLVIQEGGSQRDPKNYKERIMNLEGLLQKETGEKESLLEKVARLEKMGQEASLKDERIMTLENRNSLLMREIEEWKRRHESFQKSIEKEIDKKRQY